MRIPEFANFPWYDAIVRWWTVTLISTLEIAYSRKEGLREHSEFMRGGCEMSMNILVKKNVQLTVDATQVLQASCIAALGHTHNGTF